MKKDMVAVLMEMFDKFHPDFQKTFELEYPKLAEDDRIRFLKFLHVEMDKLSALLDKLNREAEVAAVAA